MIRIQSFELAPHESNPEYRATGNLSIIAPDEHISVYTSDAKSRFGGEENDMTALAYINFSETVHIREIGGASAPAHQTLLL